MIEELKVYDAIIAAIMDGSYGHDIDEMYVVNCSTHLRQEAEIFISLKPGQAWAYLMQRKDELYQTLTKVAGLIEEVDRRKQLSLEFLEVSIAHLHRTYCEWLGEMGES